MNNKINHFEQKYNETLILLQESEAKALIEEQKKSQIHTLHQNLEL